MATIQQEIESFNTFVREKVGSGGCTSMDDLYDQWRELHPAAEDALAIQASIRDMQNGDTGRPFEEFAEAFRKRNGISSDR